MAEKLNESASYIIQPATSADADALADLHFLSHTTSFAEFASPEWVASRRLDDYRRQWRDFFSAQAPGSQAWAARVDGSVTGMVKITPMSEPGLAQLASMHVHPDFHGRGIGSALMKTAVSFMRETGYRRAILGVIQANHKARRLYERGGWTALELRETGIEGVPVATYGIELG